MSNWGGGAPGFTSRNWTLPLNLAVLENSSGTAKLDGKLRKKERNSSVSVTDLLRVCVQGYLVLNGNFAFDELVREYSVPNSRPWVCDDTVCRIKWRTITLQVHGNTIKVQKIQQKRNSSLYWCLYHLSNFKNIVKVRWIKKTFLFHALVTEQNEAEGCFGWRVNAFLGADAYSMNYGNSFNKL